MSTAPHERDEEFTGAGQIEPWMRHLAAVAPWQELLAVDADERIRRGYGHTLREIVQQPVLWADSAARGRHGLEAIDHVRRPQPSASLRQIVLTGSGSSEYAAECVAASIHERWDAPSRPVPASLLLTFPSSCMAASGRQMAISFARSGDSPESAAVVDLLLQKYPDCSHVVITCNAAGRLATAYSTNARVHAIVLAPETNDRSLVMTSSFTNMVVAGQALAASSSDEYLRAVQQAAASARAMLETHAGALAQVAREQFRNVCYLASSPHLGAAREAALKMMEMSGGEVSTIVETPLGLRHGPMAALRGDTLLVAGLASAQPARSYTLDVLEEIDAKGLARRRVVIGSDVPPDLGRERDVIVSLPHYDPHGTGLSAVLDVLLGQILAFFRCMAGSLRPDAPSPERVITRVVPPFRIYR